MTLEFSNLPLEEVVIRMALRTPLEITFEQYARLWKRLETSFPNASELQVLEVAPMSPLSLKATHLPGVQFTRPDLVLTIQGNMLNSKWHRNSRIAYPRYEQLRDAIDQGYKGLADTVGSDQAAARIVNMTYTNVIVKPPSEEGLDFVARFISTDFLPSRASGKELHDVNSSWREADGIDLRLSVQSATLNAPIVKGDSTVVTEERKAFMVTTSAGVFVETLTKPLSEINRVHDALQVFFASIITDRAKEEWGYAGTA